MTRIVCATVFIIFTAVLTTVSLADTLIDFSSSDAYVTANKDLQGRIGNPAWVPFSTSARSPAADYTGPEFFGGATATVSITTWLLANATPDYALLGSGTAGIGDRGMMLIIFTNELSTVTNVLIGNRPNGDITGQTNWLRVVMEQDSQYYISEEYFVGAGLTDSTFDRAELEALSWFEYDPASNLMDAGSAVPGLQVTNISAVGVYRGQELTTVDQTTLAGGIYAFTVTGDPGGSPPPPPPPPPGTPISINFTSSTEWVTASQNLPGRTGSPLWVPFSITTPRSPASGYSGPVFYGGATATVSITTWLLANSTPDYILLGSGTAGIGDKGVAVIVFTNTAGTITNFTMGNRPSGVITGQTNWLRVVARSGERYAVSEAIFVGAGIAEFTYDRAELESLSWYDYDPTNSMLDAGAAIPGFQMTNITAAGVFRAQELTTGDQTQLAGGLFSIVYMGYTDGEAGDVPEPILTLTRTGVDFVVSWTSTVGRVYAVETSTQLVSSTGWSEIPGATNWPGTGDWLSYTGSAADVLRNWRVRSDEQP